MKIKGSLEVNGRKNEFTVCIVYYRASIALFIFEKPSFWSILRSPQYGPKAWLSKNKLLNTRTIIKSRGGELIFPAIGSEKTFNFH